jgi:hypothetical protein
MTASKPEIKQVNNRREQVKIKYNPMIVEESRFSFTLVEIKGNSEYWHYKEVSSGRNCTFGG